MTPQEIVRKLDKGLFHFIAGPAGSGKSYLIREIKKANPWDCYLTASTGVAAVQLANEAITINSFLGGYPTVDHLEANPAGVAKALEWRSGKGTRAIRIFIDEVSMISDRHLTLLVEAIERHNEEASAPVSLIISGDMCQLSPVDGDFAFESKEWDRFEENTIELKGTHRQADKDFIEALRFARAGQGKKALEYFRPMIHRSIDENLSSTTLFYKNIDVARYNKKKIAALHTVEDAYKADRDGKQLREWNRSKIPDYLKLKRGCQVMILANRYSVDEDSRRKLVYVNGDLGTYLERAGEEEALVRIYRNQEVVAVRYIERESNHGAIKYMPIKAAYASTLYKIQGLSLDSLQVVITDPFFEKTPGLLYVALSRARTPEGIRIVGTPNLFVDRCKTDKRIKRWL